jgi:hypothetical protein
MDLNITDMILSRQTCDNLFSKSERKKE